MLATVAQLDSGQQNRPLARLGRISRFTSQRAIECLVIGHVGRIETCSSVPVPVSLRGESGAPIMRCVGVAVKIHRDQIGIMQIQRSHRSWADQHDSEHRHRASENARCAARSSERAETSEHLPLANESRGEEANRAQGERRPVLRGGKNRDCVEGVGRGGKHVIQEGRAQSGGGRGRWIGDVHQRWQRKNRRDYQCCSNHERPSVSRQAS